MADATNGPAGTTDATFSVPIAAKSGTLFYARTFLVGWNGWWSSGGGTRNAGISIQNNSVSGSTLTVGIRGFQQRLYTCQISYIIATQNTTFTVYEQFVDGVMTGGSSASGSATIAVPGGTTTPNFVGSVFGGLTGFQFYESKNWGIKSTVTLTGTTSVALTYVQTLNSSSGSVL